jgi:hypothetical protein
MREKMKQTIDISELSYNEVMKVDAVYSLLQRSNGIRQLKIRSRFTKRKGPASQTGLRVVEAAISPPLPFEKTKVAPLGL